MPVGQTVFEWKAWDHVSSPYAPLSRNSRSLVMMCLFPVAAMTMSTLLKMSSIRTTLKPSMQAWNPKVLKWVTSYFAKPLKFQIHSVNSVRWQLVNWRFVDRQLINHDNSSTGLRNDNSSTDNSSTGPATTHPLTSWQACRLAPVGLFPFTQLCCKVATSQEPPLVTPVLDPTVWLHGASPANTCIPPRSLPGDKSMRCPWACRWVVCWRVVVDELSVLSPVDELLLWSMSCLSTNLQSMSCHRTSNSPSNFFSIEVNLPNNYLLNFFGRLCPLGGSLQESFFLIKWI